jgi:hypothetical protein
MWQGNFTGIIKFNASCSRNLLSTHLRIASGVPTQAGRRHPKSEGLRKRVGEGRCQVCPGVIKATVSQCETAAEGAEYGLRLASGRNESEAVATLEKTVLLESTEALVIPPFKCLLWKAVSESSQA